MYVRVNLLSAVTFFADSQQVDALLLGNKVKRATGRNFLKGVVIAQGRCEGRQRKPQGGYLGRTPVA